MSEEGGNSLKNSIIGLITVVVTALTGMVANNFLGEDDTGDEPVAAAAPVINLNLENNNQLNNNGGPDVIIIESDDGDEEEDAHLRAKPKW